MIGVFVVPGLLFGPGVLDLDNGRTDAAVARRRGAHAWKILELFSDFSRRELREIEMQLLEQAPFAAPHTELSSAQHAVDQRLLAACRGLTDAQMEMPVAISRRAGVLHESATRLLAHLFEHQIHHRGQAHAMLAGTPVKPPQLDEFFCANEAHLRARELREIGLSEEAVWS